MALKLSVVALLLVSVGETFQAAGSLELVWKMDGLWSNSHSFPSKERGIFRKPPDLESVSIKCQCFHITSESLIEMMGHYVMSCRPQKTLLFLLC